MPRPKPPGPDVARPKGNKYCLKLSLLCTCSSLESSNQVLNFMHNFLNKFLERNMSDLLRFFLLQSYLTKITDFVCITFFIIFNCDLENGEIHINNITVLLT